MLVVVLAAATAFGLWRRHTDGRMTVVAPVADAVEPVPGLPDPGAPSGAGAPGRGEPTEQALHDELVAHQEVDDSEPLLVDGRAVEPADHAVVPRPDHLTEGELGAALGERATLVQFSSAFCQPCRATRLVLGDVAGVVPGVAHVEVDAESHLELVRRLDVTRTPTVLLLDSSGRIRTRATGAPRKADVLAALADIV